MPHARPQRRVQHRQPDHLPEHDQVHIRLDPAQRADHPGLQPDARDARRPHLLRILVSQLPNLKCLIKRAHYWQCLVCF